MKTTALTSFSDSLYPAFADIYASSFPIFEQRTKAQQLHAFADRRYRLDAYTDNRGTELIGFLSYWTFESFVYIEHFAINANHRGHGEGSKMLKAFLECSDANNLIVILEIDPPIDAVSISRQHFYERSGLVLNGFVHMHPPYRNEYKAHELRIMSSGGVLSADMYNDFCRSLHEIVF